MQSAFRTELDDSMSKREDELSEVLKCVICLDDVEEAHLCPTCSTLGCLKCFRRWLLYQYPSNCPTCRTSLLSCKLIKCRPITEVTKLIKHLKEKNTKLKISNKSLESQNIVGLNKIKSLAHAHSRDILKITEIEKGVLDRDRTILRLRREEKDQNDTISRIRKQSVINAQMKKELQDKYQVFVNLNTEEKEKNEAIFEQITSALKKAESDLKKKDEIISELAAESNKKDASILILQSESRGKDAAILKLSNNIAAKQALLKKLLENKTRSLSTSIIDSCTEGNKGTAVVLQQIENEKDISSVAIAGKPTGARLGQDLVGNEKALLANEIRREFDQKILELKKAQDLMVAREEQKDVKISRLESKVLQLQGSMVEREEQKDVKISRLESKVVQLQGSMVEREEPNDVKVSKLESKVLQLQNKADFIMRSIVTLIPSNVELNNNNIECNSDVVKGSPSLIEAFVETESETSQENQARELSQFRFLSN